MKASYCNIQHKSNNYSLFDGLVHQQTCYCKQIKSSIKHLTQYWIHDCWWNLNNCSNMFVTLLLELQKMKFNILPFCEVNIMFTKDFLQFSPIIDTSLCSTNIQPTLSVTKLTQKQMIGKRFWENYIHHDNIILTKQMQQNKVVQYVHVFKIFIMKKKSFQILNYSKHNFSWIWK